MLCSRRRHAGRAGTAHGVAVVLGSPAGAGAVGPAGADLDEAPAQARQQPVAMLAAGQFDAVLNTQRELVLKGIAGPVGTWRVA